MQSRPLQGIAIIAAMALSACAAGDPDRFGSAGVPPSSAAVDQTRLQLVDRCMFEVGPTVGAEQKIGPVCQCFARGALRQMSSFEIGSVAGGGSFRGSVRGSEVYAACARSTNAFAETAPRARAKRPGRENPQTPAVRAGADEKKPE